MVVSQRHFLNKETDGIIICICTGQSCGYGEVRNDEVSGCYIFREIKIMYWWGYWCVLFRICKKRGVVPVSSEIKKCDNYKNFLSS